MGSAADIQYQDRCFPLAHKMPQMEAALRRAKQSELAGNLDAQSYTGSRSHRLRREDVKKPWNVRTRSPKEKLTEALPLIGAFLGAVVAAVLIWDGWHSVINHRYTLLYEDDFSSGLDKSIWESEIQVGGFG